jgi:hypothetical protein
MPPFPQKYVINSSCNTKKLRLRKFKRDVRQRLRLGYQGRRRKVIELLNRPTGQLFAGLINDLNKLSKPSKRVRSAALIPL